jgi:hypothetical protein
MAAGIDGATTAGLGLLAGVLVWRAHSQSITYDEAVTWLAFVRRPLPEALTSFTANNHLLFTVLAWLVTHGLGVSELTLRLPSVVAGFGFLAVARALAHATCSQRALYPVVTAALVLNPFVLDFMVAARGYGLAATALLFAVLQVLRWPGAGTSLRRHAIFTGLALGVSIASNLAFLFPAFALGAVWIGLVTWSGTPHLRTAIHATYWLGASALCVVVPLLIRLLAEPLSSFYYGAETFAETSRSLVAASLQFDTVNRWHVSDASVDLIALVLVPLALASWTIAAVATVMARGREATITPDLVRLWPLVVIGGTTGMTVGCLAVAHVAFGVLLPLERTGLYWLPLIVLGLAASARALSGQTALHRIGRAVIVLGIGALAIAFVAQFTTSHFRTWRFDSGSRDMFTRVEEWPCPTDRQRRLTTTPWLYEPALEFYRVVRNADHVRPLNIDHESYTPGDADFYVIESPNEVRALRPVAVPLFTHSISDATLLVDRELSFCAR